MCFSYGQIIAKVRKALGLELSCVISSYDRQELITLRKGTAYRFTYPTMVLAILTFCCTSLTLALIIYVQTPHSVTCIQKNKSFTKHLSLQKLNIISRTNPPIPADAINRIRKHQDVKAKVLREHFSRKPRIRLEADPFLGYHPRDLTLRRSPPWQYSMANSGKSFGASFCIPSGTSRAATTLGWFSLWNKN